jgi:broad specificity phosphatase PhoE
MSSFIFVRHGKSQANHDHIIAAPDSPLTKEGEVKARKLGRELKKQGITLVVASPYVRARQTADIIAKELKIKEDVVILDDLRERGFGQLQDRPKDHPTEWYFTIDGEADVEPRGVLIARCESALAQIKKLAEAHTVVVVGHGTSGFYLRQVAAGKRFFEDFDPPYEMRNATQVRVTIADKIPMKRTSREAAIAFLAILAGVICLAAGIWLFNQRQAAAPGPQVKQTEIPLQPEDYNGDPNLQGAIQKQLQQQSEAEQATGGASEVLQPAPTGVPKTLTP